MGQQAENLLDFDDVPSDQPSGLASTQLSSPTPAAANLIAGTSLNPLDDLVSVFGNMGAQPLVPGGGFGAPSPIPQQNAFAGLGFGGAGSVVSPSASQPTVSAGQAKKDEDDLLGLF